MKIALQYVNDSLGQLQYVQVPVTEWEKLMAKMKHYEQALKIKTELHIAFKEVEQLRKSKACKQTLNDFLNEL